MYYREVDGQIQFFTGNILNYEGHSILNPTEEQMLEAGWLVYVEPEPTKDEILERAKLNKIAEIEEYDSSPEVNTFYLGGQSMWLDAQTRQTLRISIESYVAMNIETVSKWFNGHQFTFTTNVWLQMLNALEVYAAEALNVTESHKANVHNLINVEDVNQYDFTTGYPEKLNFNSEWIYSLSQG